jgi:hypothetical protein
VAGFSRKARSVDPTRAGLLDENSTTSMDRGDGGDDLQRWIFPDQITLFGFRFDSLEAPNSSVEKARSEGK